MAAWDETAREALANRLRGEVAALADGEFLVVGEAAPAATEKRRFGRRATPPPRRYVQFRRADEWVYGECVGARLFGGDWPTTAEQDAAIRAAGWLAPGDEDPTQTQPGYPNYWRTVPTAQATDLAAMGVAALEALGVDPAAVEVERGQA
jgi:hypothetical protein